MNEHAWMTSAKALPPAPKLPVRCHRCNRFLRTISWDPHNRCARLEGSITLDDRAIGFDPSAGRRQLPADENGNWARTGRQLPDGGNWVLVNRPSASRWWDASPPDAPGSRYRYHCGGTHRDAEGVVTLARLQRLYLAAVAEGKTSIYL